MKTFAIIGLGYISTRHLQAIEDVNGQLVCCLDSSEKEFIFNGKTVRSSTHSAEFFQTVQNNKVDFVVICSPSHLHKEQIIKSIQAGSQVIVEKPICLSLSELDEIQAIEKKYHKQVYTIFQLRYADALLNLPNEYPEKVNVVIEYQGKRDSTYFETWKGKLNLSGGIVSAVGIHYFDILTAKFGNFTGQINIETNDLKHSKGYFELEHATVYWNFQFLPQNTTVQLKRSFKINQQEIDLSSYANNLHSIAYQKILNGKGISTSEARKSLKITEAIYSL